MGGEKGIPIAVAERRAKVDDFGKIVTLDTIENIVNLYKTIVGEHGGSQEESASISDILKIDGNAVDGSPQQNDAFPFTIAGFIPVPISQQISVTNLSHLAYLPVKSAEAVYHGYKKSYNGKIDEADKFIEKLFEKRPLTAEELKKYFKEEEKKKSVVVSAEDMQYGGKPLKDKFEDIYENFGKMNKQMLNISEITVVNSIRTDKLEEIVYKTKKPEKYGMQTGYY